MSRKLTCEVCGGGDYYTESGFYFCNECHAQSQEVVEVVVNPEEVYVYGRSLSLKSSASTSSQVSVSGDHDWTTWECYNFVLKGLVDELISCGAPPELKLVVLQLWVILLKTQSVAFVSTHEDRLPKLGFHYHDKDMYHVYGVSDKKKCKKVKKKNKEATDDDCETPEGTATPVGSSAPVKRSVTKKALAKANYDSSIIDNVDDVLSLLDHESSNSSFQQPSTPQRKGNFSRSVMFSAKAKRRFKVVKQQKLRGKEVQKDRKKRQRDPSYISRSRLLAILYLGLRLTSSNILLGDMLRWISEGVLSYNEVSHFFPACSNLKAVDGLLFGSFPRTVSHCTIRKMTAELAKLLRVNTLPAPNILSIAARYVEELQLPRDVLACVRKLYAIYPPNMEFDLTCAEVPNYEARAMGLIIVVLKLLFGLDGKTEHKISETASEFNKYLSSGKPKLFVWDDWQKYIECRKAFVSLFHFPSKEAVNGDAHGGIELYIEELKLLRQKNENGNKRIAMKKEEINPSLTSVLEHPFQKLAALEPNHFSGIRFKPSLMPYTLYLQTICEVYDLGAKLDHKIPEQLKQDFKATELKFLLDPHKFIRIARSKGMKIKLCETSAQNKVKKVQVKGRTETNILLRAFLQDESKRDGGSPPRKLVCDSTAASSGVTEQLVEDMECVNKEFEKDVEYFFINKTNRKRKHSEIRKRSETEPDVKKQEYKDGLCFKGNCKIRRTDVPDCTRTNTAPASSSGKCFRIYTPSSEYWFLGYPPKRNFNVEMFNSKVMPKFSMSFHWLLSECASLLNMTEHDLYTEVVLVETLHGYVLTPDCEAKARNNVSHFLKCVNTMW